MGLGGPMQTGVRHQPEGKSVGGSGKEGDMKREIGRVRDIEAEREREWWQHDVETTQNRKWFGQIFSKRCQSTIKQTLGGTKTRFFVHLEQIQCTSDKPVYKSATTCTAVISVVWLTRDEAGYPGFHKAGKVQPQIWLFFDALTIYSTYASFRHPLLSFSLT